MIDAVSEQLMQLEQQETRIKARLAGISDELSQLCLLRVHGDPRELGQDDILSRVQALHAERDALEADLQALAEQLGKRVTESAARVDGQPLKLKLPVLVVFLDESEASPGTP